MILICTNEFAGPTGYHKSVVETANSLHRATYPVAVLSFLGAADGAGNALPRWPLDLDVPAFVLQTLPADGGRMLHRNYHPAWSGSLGSLRYAFTANQLAALRQLNTALTPDDTIIFSSPLQTLAFQQALGHEPRRPRTVLQIHGDYLHHIELWNAFMESRDVIDRLQTVADGLRAQFSSVFADDDVVFIPNIHSPAQLERTAHENVNIVLPASFQDRKNQLDAVRALALIDDESVHLTLWGNINPLNPYYISVRQLIDSLGLGERVHLPGFGTESDVYGAADIVLMTSLSEGFGYPLIEAAYHHLPAVAYDFDFGPRETIENGETGYVVPLGDVTQLAARLTELAADPALRQRFGEAARRVFDERFSTTAVTERYQRMLGAPGAAVDLVEAFATDGAEPVALGDITHDYRLQRRGGVHRITVASPAALHDVQIDNGTRSATVATRQAHGATLIEFRAEGNEVVSYAPAAGSPDRHYLANTRGHGFEVLPYLRRDATYGDGTPPVDDTIFAASGGARRVEVRETGRILGTTATLALGEFSRQFQQLTGLGRKASASKAAPTRAAPAPGAVAPSPAAPAGPASPAPAPAPARENPSRGGITRALGLSSGALGPVRRMVTTYGKTAVSALALRIATIPSAPTRREIARHPRFPVVAGVDNFGTAINQPGGVIVHNAGSAARPTVTVNGEYDWLLVRDAAGERRIEPPYAYGEFFERVCAAEREHGLFELTTPGGVHLWELGRSAMVIQLAEALGFWGKAPDVGVPVSDVYLGSKRLADAPHVRRVVFDYAKRGQKGYRTAAFRDDETLFVVPPEPDGYPEVTEDNLVYPLHEYTAWRTALRQRWSHLRVEQVDAQPFNSALGAALGIRVDLADHLRNRLAQFLAEREFWTPVFERIKPDEVLISASHWRPGVVAAARRAGALVSDIQYAETGRHHGTFWFGGRPHHGADRLYAWSEEWAARTNVYREHVVVPRQQPELTAAIASGDAHEPVWDVCVVSQPRVFRRIIAFLQTLVEERPELRIVIAPHPVQRLTIDADLAAAGLAGKVTVTTEGTLAAVQQAAVCLGGYSTSMWEAAAIGRPTYVIPVPGHELTLPDVESGIFRLATSPHDLVPYELPAAHRTIFGNA